MAYPLIIHMSSVIVNIITKGNIRGLISIISHRLISIGLCYISGIIEERYKTKKIIYVRGIKGINPILERLWSVLLLANSSFPFFISFI